jgi:hypothetical protein
MGLEPLGLCPLGRVDDAAHHSSFVWMVIRVLLGPNL